MNVPYHTLSFKVISKICKARTHYLYLNLSTIITQKHTFTPCRGKGVINYVKVKLQRLSEIISMQPVPLEEIKSEHKRTNSEFKHNISITAHRILTTSLIVTNCHVMHYFTLL